MSGNDRQNLTEVMAATISMDKATVHLMVSSLPSHRKAGSFKAVRSLRVDHNSDCSLDLEACRWYL